jgi:dihydrofolate synthase/folylpolyglutamate synthase
MNYRQSVDYLLTLLGTGGQRYGLERIEALVEVLGRPDQAFRSIHIAGTNGKGSTGAMIEAGLRASGSTTGFFSSPHLFSFTERFRINGKPIGEDAFAASITTCRRAAEQLAANTNGGLQPTMFEITTAAAFCAFADAEVGWAVIETGLGGRLDSTNVIEPELTVITSIALDHEDKLGSTLAAIAAEKAGILKPTAAAIFAPQVEEAAAVLTNRGTAVAKSVTWAAGNWQLQASSPNPRGRFQLTVNGPGEKQITALLALPGPHQIENAITALASLDALDIPLAAITRGLETAEWPGRLEWLPTAPEVLLDAAHNPAGTRALARFLEQSCTDRRITLIFAVSRDKAIDEMAAALFPIVDRVILTRSSVIRSADPETLASDVGHHGRVIEIAQDAAAAWACAARDQSPEHLVVIAGSIFLVGDLREQLIEQELTHA